MELEYLTGIDGDDLTGDDLNGILGALRTAGVTEGKRAELALKLASAKNKQKVYNNFANTPLTQREKGPRAEAVDYIDRQDLFRDTMTINLSVGQTTFNQAITLNEAYDVCIGLVVYPNIGIPVLGNVLQIGFKDDNRTYLNPVHYRELSLEQRISFDLNKAYAQYRFRAAGNRINVFGNCTVTVGNPISFDVVFLLQKAPKGA